MFLSNRRKEFDAAERAAIARKVQGFLSFWEKHFPHVPLSPTAGEGTHWQFIHYPSRSLLSLHSPSEAAINEAVLGGCHPFYVGGTNWESRRAIAAFMTENKK